MTSGNMVVKKIEDSHIYILGFRTNKKKRKEKTSAGGRMFSEASRRTGSAFGGRTSVGQAWRARARPRNSRPPSRARAGRALAGARHFF